MQLMTHTGIIAADGGFDNFVIPSSDPYLESHTRDTSAGLGTATTGIQFLSNGHVQTYGNINQSSDSISSAVNDGYWFSRAPVSNVGANYEIFVTFTSATGSATRDTEPPLSTWLPLSTTRLFEVSNTGNNVEDFSTVEWAYSIRNATTLNVLVSSAVLRASANLIGP